MNRGVNEKSVCFILCSNNQLYTEECIYYITHLNVPEGYSIDILAIEEAKSMTAGYNKGMEASNAKYKVYLHQDTFIVNKNFIQDFLEVFRQDNSIGMIGMVGAPKLPDNGIMWDVPRCGAFYKWNVHETREYWMTANDALTQVEVIDGFLMITQYDIRWRDDLFDKWDFYDCSQSKEFARHGFKVVVPRLGKPWCIHDSGLVNLKYYYGERIKFIEEYHAEIPACQESDSYRVTVIVTTCNRREQLQDMLRWLEDVDGVSNIIIVDNGSQDGTSAWLSTEGYEYIWFDEGVQGYGKVWNTVLQNFETEEYIVFLEAGVYPEKRSLIELVRALQSEKIGMASPVTNFYNDDQNMIVSRDSLTWFWESKLGREEPNTFYKTLFSNCKIWAVKRSILYQNGLFKEKLKYTEDVLTDFALRMIISDLVQVVCPRACAYESFLEWDEIYAEAEKWQYEDRIFMRNLWNMNYFNLKPNKSLVNCIQEQRQKEFKVLEVGCDLGATLYEIRVRFPNCEVYGLDINEAAVNVAQHIAKVECGDIDELYIPFQEKFDYIIFGDVLEHLRNPEKVISICRDFLCEDGYIIASIPNVMHISVMEELIEGRFRYSDTGLLDRTHIHFFTYYEIMDLFQSADYNVKSIDKIVCGISEREKEIRDALLRLSNNTEEWMYEAFQYIVKAQKGNLL